MGALLVVCGLTAAVIACRRSYILARSALVPLIQDAEARVGRETTSPQLGCFLAARGWRMPA
jgi:hypothetical protein